MQPQSMLFATAVLIRSIRAIRSVSSAALLRARRPLLFFDPWVPKILELIAEERQCCLFCTSEITIEPDEGPVSLRLHGPDEVKALVWPSSVSPFPTTPHLRESRIGERLLTLLPSWRFGKRMTDSGQIARLSHTRKLVLRRVMPLERFGASRQPR